MRLATLIAAIALTAAAQAQDIRVIDGDTVVIAGETVRLATIDAPETRRARCDAERRLGKVATRRLRELLSGAVIAVVRGDPADGRTKDRYGRTLGVVYADGTDVAMVLVEEGLARPWTGRREPWCQ